MHGAEEKPPATPAWLGVFSLWTICAIAAPGERALAVQPTAAGASENPGVAVQKARQLQRVGQLRAAEKLLRASLGGKNAAPDSPQVAGSLELLTSIYRESGRYDEARRTGAAYLRLLEAVPSRDPVVLAKRQDIAVSLAEIALAREDFPQALEMVERALSLPAGAARPTRCGNRATFALKARIEQKQGNGDGARQAWTEVEARLHAVLKAPERAPLNRDQEEAAVGLLTQALIGLGRPKEAIAAREHLLERQTTDHAAAARNLAQIAACYAELEDDAGQQRTLEAAIARLGKDRQQQAAQPDKAGQADKTVQRDKDKSAQPENREQQDKVSAEYADMVDRLALVSSIAARMMRLATAGPKRPRSMKSSFGRPPPTTVISNGRCNIAKVCRRSFSS